MPRPRPSITTARRRRGSSRVAAMTSAAVRSRQPTLAGTRVVEQGTFITGPCAAMMLADLGADVIKIESPDGDPYRSYQGEQYSPHFQAYNRNKRSLSLDMKEAKDCELFSGLVREADVYIQNFRPGTAERLGAGVARLHSLNPRLIYCSISGFGPSGPYADRPSYDSVAQALSGFLSVVVDYRRPQFLGPALADAITGLEAHDVPHAPVNRIDEVLHDPQVEHLGVIVPVEAPHGAARAVRPAVRFDGVRAEAVSAAPLLDEHGGAIRAALARGEPWPGPERG